MSCNQWNQRSRAKAKPFVSTLVKIQIPTLSSYQSCVGAGTCPSNFASPRHDSSL